MTISEVVPSCSVCMFEINNMEEINGKSKLLANKIFTKYSQIPAVFNSRVFCVSSCEETVVDG